MSISKLNADKLTEYLNNDNYRVVSVNIGNFVGVTELNVKLQTKGSITSTVEFCILGEPDVDIETLYKAVREALS